MANNTDKTLIVWLLTGCFLIMAMVIIGGITRLTHSGLSMVEWNFAVGSLPPLNEEAWQAEFSKYQQSPEYQEINYDFTVEEFKSIYWWEWLHRFLGRFIGLVFIIPFLWFWLKKKLDKPLLQRLIVLLFLGAFQGILGWYMVKSGLVKEPRVSHYRLAAHLITAFITFAWCFWIALTLFYKGKEVPVFRKVRSAIYWLFFFLTIQIIWGAFVAGLQAGTVHTTFPLMDGQWIADAITAIEPTWKNFFEGRSGVQFVHRYLAYLVVFFAIRLWWVSRKQPLKPVQKNGINLILVAVFIQFLLGVTTLVMAVPVLLGVLHQLGAFLLLAVTVYTIRVVKSPTIN